VKDREEKKTANGNHPRFRTEGPSGGDSTTNATPCKSWVKKTPDGSLEGLKKKRNIKATISRWVKPLEMGERCRCGRWEYSCEGPFARRGKSLEEIGITKKSFMRNNNAVESWRDRGVRIRRSNLKNQGE